MLTRSDSSARTSAPGCEMRSPPGDPLGPGTKKIRPAPEGVGRICLYDGRELAHEPTVALNNARFFVRLSAACS